MKRLLLAALALVGTYSITDANTVTVHNLTGCSFTLDVSLFNTPIGPGTSTLTALPGTNIVACKIIYDYGADDMISIGVGITPDFAGYANSSIYPNNPPCLATPYYTATWGQPSDSSDATVVIF